MHHQVFINYIIQYLIYYFHFLYNTIKIHYFNNQINHFLIYYHYLMTHCFHIKIHY